MATTYLEQSLANLMDFEGCVPWMYRDTAGKVTVGVGAMLPDAESATSLPFQSAGAPATASQIVVEFRRVTALPAGRLPAFYRTTGSPQLPITSVQSRLRSTLLSFEVDLRQHLPSYDTLPDRAKLALLDMAYNLGVIGLVRGYPRLMAAVSARNWTAAAAECLRHGISPERNQWTHLEFLAAAAAAGAVAEIQAFAAELRPVLRWVALTSAAGLLGWLALRAVRRSRQKPPSHS